MSTILIGLFLFLGAISCMLFWVSERQRRALGIPIGKVIYSDTSNWKRIEKSLVDPLLGLAGRPDYIVQKGQTLTPVEVKTSWAPNYPYESHILQLAAYCLLIERTTGNRPTHGIIHYRNRMFSVEYTSQLKKQLIDLVIEMQKNLTNHPIDRSHDDSVRCKHCGHQAICDQRL